MRTRWERVGRSVGYLPRTLVGPALLAALAVGTWFGWQLFVRVFTTRTVLVEPPPGAAGGRRVEMVELVDRPAWLLGLLLALLLLVAVVVCLAVMRPVARWALSASGRELERAIPEPVRLPWRRLRSVPRAFLADGHTWRTLGWTVSSGTVGLALSAAALVPVVAAVDVTVSAFRYAVYGDIARWAADGPVGGLVFQHRFAGVEPGWGATYLLAEVVVAAGWLVFLTPVLAGWHARLTGVLLTSRVGQLTERVDELTASRAGALDAHTAELLRVERDLHDGTQAHLVNVVMRLGMAERRLADDPDAVGDLLVEARTGAEDAMTELRTVLRTMYPPVLADRGLGGALHGLAARCTTVTTVDVPTGLGVPVPVEAAAYFVVAEALSNVAKHSAASSAEVTVRRAAGALVVEVTDDGLGGADEDRGTGIVGMRRRVAALDGWLAVTSPVGGPTVVVAELPCGS